MLVYQTFLIMRFAWKLFTKKTCLQLSFNSTPIHRAGQPCLSVDFDAAWAFLLSKRWAEAATRAAN